MVHLLMAAALAGAPGFDPVRDVADCAIFMRPETSPEGSAMRAECHWPELDVSSLQALLGNIGGYDRFIWAIAEERVLRWEDSRALVYQRHHVWPLSDREVLLWVQRDSLDGGFRVTWTAADEQPLELAPGSLRTVRNDGMWVVEPHPQGGVKVVHQIALDAGGSVPRWLVNLVRTRGFVNVMKDVREQAAQ